MFRSSLDLMKKLLVIYLYSCIIIACNSEATLDGIGPLNELDLLDRSKPDFTGMVLLYYISFDDLDNNEALLNEQWILHNPYMASVDSGIVGNGMRLLGSDNKGKQGGWIEIPFIDFNSKESFALEMYIKEEGMSHNDGQMLFFLGDLSYGWLGIGHHARIPRHGTLPVYHFAVGSYQEGEGNSKFLPALETEDIMRFNNNEWIKLTMLYEKGLIYGYLNDSLIGSKQQDINVYGNKAAIGRHWWDGGEKACSRFSGIIDEIKVYINEE